MMHVLCNNRGNIKLLSDDETRIITGAHINRDKDNPRNVTGHWFNNGWLMLEGDAVYDKRKHVLRVANEKVIGERLGGKSRVLALTFLTSRYKMALQEYMRHYRKGILESDNELMLERKHFKYEPVGRDIDVRKYIYDANPYRVRDFGFTKVEDYFMNSEYCDEYKPSTGKTRYFAAKAPIVYKGIPYYKPLCMSMYFLHEYYNTGYIDMDYMPEYLNNFAWRFLFRKTITTFFFSYPDKALLFNPKEDWEKDFCRRQGFVPAEIDPKHDMSEYIVYSNTYRNVD